MRTPKTVTAVLFAIALMFGGATLAEAAVPPAAQCERAENALAAAHRLDANLAANEERLLARRARAEAAGREVLVARIDAQLARVDARQARLAARIDRLEAAITEHCTPPAS